MTPNFNILAQRLIAFDAEEDKPYKCQQCGMKYLTMQTAKRHIGLKHSDGGSLSCVVKNCDKKFTVAAQMRDHVVRMHGEGGMLCPIPHCKARKSTITR